MSRAWLQPLAAVVGYRPGEQTLLLAERAANEAARALRVSPEEAARRVLGNDAQAYRAFADAVAIHETYFFRHPEHFELLSARAAAAASEGRPLRTAWSVGCSTGEEAWSLLLTLAPYATDALVAGSDLSEAALGVARRGRYPRRAFRNGAPAVGAGLLACGEEWEVSAPLRERARFFPLNLAHGRPRPPPPFPAQVDVIFCRNVLVYLTHELAEQVFRALGEALAPGGLLVVGAVEMPQVQVQTLQPLANVPGAFVRADAAAAPSRPRARAASTPLRPPRPTHAAQDEELARARLLADEGRLDDALRVAERADRAPEALYLRASIHLEQGDLAHAGALLHKLLCAQPDCVPAHLQLALVALKRGDTRAVERHRSAVQRLLQGRGDEEELGMEGMRTAWARQVLRQLGPERAP